MYLCEIQCLCVFCSVLLSVLSNSLPVYMYIFFSIKTFLTEIFIRTSGKYENMTVMETVDHYNNERSGGEGGDGGRGGILINIHVNTKQ